MSEAAIPLALVVAVAQNGVIGRDGDLPWRISDDLKWFKAITTGKPILMGRTTWESLGRPLPGRDNIVLSRQNLDLPEGVRLVHGLDEAMVLARASAIASGAEEACIIGGAAVYEAALPFADRLYVTHVLADVDGDRSFDLPNRQSYDIQTVKHIAASEKNEYAARVERWDRRRPD